MIQEAQDAWIGAKVLRERAKLARDAVLTSDFRTDLTPDQLKAAARLIEDATHTAFAQQ